MAQGCTVTPTEQRPLRPWVAGVRLSNATRAHIEREARRSGRSISDVMRGFIEAGIVAADGGSV